MKFLKKKQKIDFDLEEVFATEIQQVETKSSVDAVADSLDKNFKSITEIEEKTRKIAGQNSFSAFFSKGQNIKELSNNLNCATSVIKSSLDLIVLLMGSSVSQKQDSDTIMQTLMNLEEHLGDSDEDVEYFLKIKKVVELVQEKNKTIESIEKRLKTLSAAVLAMSVLSIIAIIFAILAIK